jgi:primosomal protein N' (replication factor Y)
MYTYEVWIRSVQYHGKEPLTYTHTKTLLPGTVVRVSLRHTSTLGVVKRTAPAPKGVALKPIEEVIAGDDLAVPKELLRLIEWMNKYYPAGSGSIVQLILPANWPKKSPTTGVAYTSLFTPHQLPPLTQEQARALKILQGYTGTAILHGDTGTGKTRIYIELLKKAIAEGRSGLVLVPEIGLTPQLYTELKRVFHPDKINVIHSGLTPAERRTVWFSILQNTLPQIVIGPRSALFAPIKNLGCIIVDECHDSSYKQDNTPYYNALRVASHLSLLHDAVTVFGSATPNISDVYIAKQKEAPIIRLTNLARSPRDRIKVKTHIVSRQHKQEFTTSKYLSTTLIHEITQQLKKRQQSLLFLNRRGSARVVVCSNCGWRAVCPKCDLPVTLHEDSFTLRCHTCGYNQPAPTQCPDCSNVDILYLSPGTKGLEKELSRLFPGATIARFDSDNLTNERLDKQLDAIKSGYIDIIVGTQILVKGFDITNLSLVGIIDADATLSFPDFSTEEQTFQLITQAIGRVGRGHVNGTIVLQAFDSTNPLLHQALTKDWQTFYDTQLALRKAHNFPPFTFLLQLECRRKNRQSAQKAAASLRHILETFHSDITILGPTPSYREKQNGYYSWQLVIKSLSRSTLITIIEALPSGWKYNIDPSHLL